LVVVVVVPGKKEARGIPEAWAASYLRSGSLQVCPEVGVEEEGIRYQVSGGVGGKTRMGSGVMMIWQIGHQDPRN
jgi:hypothetical protein